MRFFCIKNVTFLTFSAVSSFFSQKSMKQDSTKGFTLFYLIKCIYFALLEGLKVKFIRVTKKTLCIQIKYGIHKKLYIFYPWFWNIYNVRWDVFFFKKKRRLSGKKLHSLHAQFLGIDLTYLWKKFKYRGKDLVI